MTTTRHNRKAGNVILKVTDRARLLEHQVEAGATADRLAEILFACVKELVRAHKLAGKIEDQVVAANRLVCRAEYLPPAAPLVEVPVLAEAVAS